MFDVEREGEEDQEGKKLAFKRVQIDFGFTTKEISLPLSISPCKDSTQSNK